jgi:hypothetical protein
MLRFSIEGANQIGEGIWHAQLHPSQVRKLGPCSNTYGKLSVILVTAAAGGGDGKLEFEPDCAHVLNIGTSSKAIFVLDPELDAITVSEPSSPLGAVVHAPGDRAFLGDLPNGLRSLGEELLARVRQQFPGELVHRGRRHVESPDNFWTVEYQPRVKDLQLTVRGVPKHFVVPDGIELKPDRHPYSSFKISRSDQIPGALSIIRQARRKDGEGRRFGG